MAESSGVGEDRDLAAMEQMLGDAMLARSLETAPGMPTALVARDRIRDVIEWLRDARGYQLLRSVTAVDFLDADPRFQVVYHLAALPDSMLGGQAIPSEAFREIRIKVGVPDADPVIASVTPIYPTADWHEREVWDLFGIDFAGHPGIRRILMPEDWDGHPLRKDYPLTYEEVAFSFNAEDVYASKPFAED